MSSLLLSTLILLRGSSGLLLFLSLSGGSLLFLRGSLLFLRGSLFLFFLLSSFLWSLLLGGSNGLLLLLGGGSLDKAAELLNLLGNAFLFTCGVLCTTSISLFSKLLLTDFLLFHLVDGFDQDSLVLVEVTLGTEIEGVVKILGDLLGITILAKEATKNSLTSHP